MAFYARLLTTSRLTDAFRPIMAMVTSYAPRLEVSMAAPQGFKIADFGYEIEDLVKNGNDVPVFKEITIDWGVPQRWKKDEDAPISDVEHSHAYVYAIVVDHQKSKTKEKIAYVGLTRSLDRRFHNHPKAHSLIGMKRTTYLSVGRIKLAHWPHSQQNKINLVEELEHILIWTMMPTHNERKLFNMPGFGKNGMSSAWRIFNTGHPFSGRMPKEIVYPWLLIKPRRNNTVKRVT